VRVTAQSTSRFAAFSAATALIATPRIADALQTAVVQSYHHALQSGDAETQLNILQEFSKQAAADPAMRNWMQAEYGEDLQRLASSADVEVSGEASRLLDQLDR